MEIPPLIHVAAQKKADAGGRKDDSDQKKVQSGQKRKIQDKSGKIQEQERQRFPDMFGRLGIAGTGVHRFFLQFLHIWICDMGIGSGASFLPDVADDRRADLDPPVQGVFIHIAEQAVQKHQYSRENADGDQQFGQRCKRLDHLISKLS